MNSELLLLEYRRLFLSSHSNICTDLKPFTYVNISFTKRVNNMSTFKITYKKGNSITSHQRPQNLPIILQITPT